MTADNPSHSSTAVPHDAKSDSPSTHHISAKASSPSRLPIIPIVIVAALLVGVFFFLQSSTPAPAPVVPTELKSNDAVIAQPSVEGLSFTQRVEKNETLKRTLSKAKYTIELYRVDRSSYRLFDAAAQYTGSTYDEIKSFFLQCCDLESEQDIFSALPPVPSDFASVAYDIATGSLLQLGQITPAYYLQPEFYFHVGETAGANRRIAFRAWSQPELEYWGDNGHLTYPSEQWGVVDTTKDNLARAVVFYSAGWNIQNYQGLMLVADAKSRELFDIEIQADSTSQPYFLLSPTFPRFYPNWAEKVTITVRAKPGVAPGEYSIGINPSNPPANISEKWAIDHKGLYFNGRGSISAEGDQIVLHISVR